MALAPALAYERVKVYRATFVEDDPGSPGTDESVDELGNPVPTPDPQAPEDTTEVRASVRPVGATEEELGRSTRINHYHVYLPPEVELDGLSRLEWRGKLHQVVGDPEEVHGPGGRRHHQKVLVREVAG